MDEMLILQWYHFLTARFFQIVGLRKQAITSLEMAIDLNPDFWVAIACLGHLYATEKEKDLPKAEKYFEMALNIRPEDGPTWFNMGFIREAENNYEAALHCFRKAVSFNPRIDRAWYGMGMCLAHLGKHDEAIKAFEEAAALQPFSPYPLYQIGMAYYTLGQDEKIVEVVRRLERFDSKMTHKLIKDAKLPGVFT